MTRYLEVVQVTMVPTSNSLRKNESRGMCGRMNVRSIVAPDNEPDHVVMIVMAIVDGLRHLKLLPRALNTSV